MLHNIFKILLFCGIYVGMAAEIQNIKSIAIGSIKIKDYTVVKDNNGSLFLIIIPEKKNVNYDSLLIYDTNLKPVLQNSKKYDDVVLNFSEIKINQYIEVDETLKKIKGNYTKIEIIESLKEKLMLFNDDEIVFYDLCSKELKKVKKESSVKYDYPLIFKDYLIYLSKKNKLTVYNLNENKNVWSVSSGKQDAYFLGIKLGSFEDSFRYYILDKKGERNILYANTFSGCLYKIDFNTGKVILKVERFKGNANNAGLIGNFELFNMNDDGVKDMVGPSVDYNIYCIDGKKLSVIWEYNTGYEIQMPLSFYDITNDNIPDVFGVNDEMRLLILNGKNGQLIYEKVLQDNNYQTKIILADINGNGFLNIITTGGSDDYIRIMEMPYVNVPINSILYIPK